jgi:hypothetical protein
MKIPSQRTNLHFFKKQTTDVISSHVTENDGKFDESNQLEHPQSLRILLSSAIPSQITSLDTPSLLSTSTSTSTSPSPTSSSSYGSSDIGLFINKAGDLDDHTKYNIIKNSWQPPKKFKFPFSVHKKRNKETKSYVNNNHLNNYEWLVYSDVKKELFCKYCVAFSDFCGANRNIKLEKLCTKPLITFAKLTGKDGDLQVHEKSNYHRNSVTSAEIFFKIFNDPSLSIVNLLNTDSLSVIEDNRQRLKPII